MSDRCSRLMSRSALFRYLGALTMAMVCMASHAEQANTDPEADNGWKVRTTAYLWMANISGDQTVNGEEAELDTSFSDTLEVLDFAAELHVEAMKDQRWGWFIDATYLRLGPEGEIGPVNVQVDYKYWLLELGGAYRAQSWDTDNGPASFDLLLGGRYTSMDVTTSFENSPLPSTSGRESWTDLFVGARWITALPHKWTLLLRGDIGGFGIRDSSDLSLQGFAMLHRELSLNWNVVVGYRALKQDYSRGSGSNKFAYDATTHGPILGLEYAF